MFNQFLSGSIEELDAGSDPRVDRLVLRPRISPAAKAMTMPTTPTGSQLMTPDYQAGRQMSPDRQVGRQVGRQSSMRVASVSPPLKLTERSNSAENLTEDKKTPGKRKFDTLKVLYKIKVSFL